MQTLLLDTQLWDLTLDAFGNIAVAAEPYAIGQDVASAIRLFNAELYYDITKGVRYFEDILGYAPPLALIKAELTNAAKTVPTVTAAKAFIAVTDDRVVTGQVQCTSSFGTVVVTGGVASTGPFVIQVTGVGLGAIP